MKRIIAEAFKRRVLGKKPFLRRDIKKSQSWVTCACGKQDPRIPREPRNEYWDGYAPKDKKLYSAGVMFFESLEKQNPAAALKVLGLIERRSALILKKVSTPSKRRTK